MIDLKALHLHWRVSHYKGTTYRSYSLAHSYRHNGTNRKDIVLKLGKLSDEEAGRWRALLQAAKTPHTFFTTLHRSEERRVGKECRSRGSGVGLRKKDALCGSEYVV